MAENVETIHQLFQEDRRRRINLLADTTRITYGVQQENLTENLNMRRKSAKFAPRLLTNE
jgi:hypothetical protein